MSRRGDTSSTWFRRSCSLRVGFVSGARRLRRLGIGVGREGDKGVGTVRLKLKPQNMVVATACTLLLVTLVVYVLLEYFTFH